MAAVARAGTRHPLLYAALAFSAGIMLGAYAGARQFGG